MSERHERFIVGQGESGRMYVVQTTRPRFIAELFEADDDAAFSGGLSLSLPESGEILANFVWLDDPAELDAHALRREVAECLEEFDFRSQRDVEAGNE